MRPITDVARDLGIDDAFFEPYGRDKGKIALAAMREPRGRLVLVSAITPTPAGEGKTTTSIGLAQGAALNGVRTAVALREPSLGPYLGMKGGGTGGGKSRLVPTDDVNMHFTGDFHAVGTAHNLLAAMADNHLQHGNALEMDARRIVWKRVMDINDRALRQLVTGLGGTAQGVPREAGFNITAASEIMAILCLANDVADLKARLGRIVVGYRRDGSAVTATDLNAVGAMAAILRDAIKPNIVQTLEGVPAFVHGGPFANIAHGTNSVNATRMALGYADLVFTEAGFAFDLGAEKFFDINCRYGKLAPSATVLVATLRALKMHGGTALADAAKPDCRAVERGLENLDAHLDTVKRFEQACVVAINHFPTDTDEEIALVRRHAESKGLKAAVAKTFSDGGPGCRELAEVVWDVAQKAKPHFKPIYEWDRPIEEKIEAISKHVYGASGVEYQPKALKDIKQLQKQGHDKLPVCMAKTQYSLSDNPKLLGRPKDFTITVREIELAAGAGFTVPITGEILRMPGLPKAPLAERFDLSEEGEIVFSE